MVFALLQGFVTVYTWNFFVMFSSLIGVRVISSEVESSDFVLPPARFIVRCVVGPLSSSCLATFFDSKLWFDPLSSIARHSMDSPLLLRIFTFCTGHKAVDVLTFFSCSTALLCRLWFSAVTSSSSTFTADTFLSLCKERWWFFLHLSQDVPSPFLQSLVWCDALRHFRHLRCFLTVSHRWLTVKPW